MYFHRAIVVISGSRATVSYDQASVRPKRANDAVESLLGVFELMIGVRDQDCVNGAYSGRCRSRFRADGDHHSGGKPIGFWRFPEWRSASPE
jgi:hypothetical protein